MGRQETSRSLGLAFVAVLVFGVATVGPRAAWAESETLAVLGVDALEVGDALGTQVTEALRKRAAETPGLRIVPGKDLVELKMVFNCDGEAPACLAQAGRSLGADKLIYGTMKRADAGRSVAISLKLLDVRDLTILKSVNETLPKRALGPPGIAAAAARWFGQLVVPPTTGAIAIQSQPADAAVLLDGAPVGHTPYRAKDLRPRTYNVTLQLEGYKASTHTIDVRAGATETLSVTLEREQRAEPTRPPVVGTVEPSPPITSEPPRPRHPGRPAKYAALGLVAGAVVTGAVAIYTWRSYVSLQDSASDKLRALAPPAGSTEQRIFYAEPKCQAPPGKTAAEASGYVADCQSGDKYAAATTGLWVAAGALAAAGVVSFIVGQRMDSKAANEHRGQAIKQSLRLVPALSTKGGGLAASFEF